jgi:hypothetical protein
MLPFNMDLGDYESVRRNGDNIYDRVNYDSMPPGNPWIQAWKDNFKQWMDEDYQEGFEEQ